MSDTNPFRSMLTLFDGSFSANQLAKYQWGSVTWVNEIFNLPNTLGPVFFGAAVVVFFSAIKEVIFSAASTRRKAFAYALLIGLFVLDILFHVVDVTIYQMYLRAETSADKSDTIIHVFQGGIIARNVDGLDQIIVLLTCWIACTLLAIRLVELYGRPRWITASTGALLAVLVFIQFDRFLMGFESNGNRKTYPILTLIFTAYVGILVLYHYICIRPAEPRTAATIFCAVSDIFTDSGVLLLVTIIFFTVVTFTRGPYVQRIYAVLPHVQVIVSYSLIPRVVTSFPVFGSIKLGEDTEDGNN